MYDYHDCIICYPYEPEIPLTDWSKPWHLENMYKWKN
jgi:hypothetical protein